MYHRISKLKRIMVNVVFIERYTSLQIDERSGDVLEEKIWLQS